MATRNYNRSNQERLHHFIDQLFNDYSKLLVVRLDFYIGNEYAEIKTYEYMNEAFIRLRNNLRFNQLFNHYITYAAKLEYGVDRRWHYHVPDGWACCYKIVFSGKRASCLIN